MAEESTGLTAYQDERAIKDEAQVLKLVTSRFEISKNYRASYDRKFDKKYQYYRSYEKYDADYWYRHQEFLPYVFSIIESITPDFVEALIGGDEFFNLMASDEIKQNADNAEKVMKYQLNDRMQFYLKILMFIKSILIFGNGVMFVGWNKKSKTFKRNEWVTDPLLGLHASVKRTITEEILNDPFIDTVFIKNFYPQPHRETLKDMAWCIERSYVDWDYIRSLKRGELEKAATYKNLDKIKTTSVPEVFKAVQEEMTNLVGIATATEEDPINKPVELLKYWTKDRLIMVANRAVVIRDTDNPFEHGELPYVDAKDYPLDKEFYAISDVDLLMPTEDIINDIARLSLDNFEDQLNTSYIVGLNTGVNPDDFISRPSGLIWTKDVNQVKPLTKQLLNVQAKNEIEWWYKTMERASGAWDYYAGATPQRQETMGGIIRLQQAAARRFGYRIKLLQKTAFKDILTQILQLDQQLLPMNYPVKVFKKNMQINLSPWDIAGKFSVQVSGSLNLTDLAERMIKVWTEAKGDPYFDQLELRKRLLDIMDVPNAEKLLVGAENMLANAQGNALGMNALTRGNVGNVAGNRGGIVELLKGLNAGA